MAEPAIPVAVASTVLDVPLPGITGANRAITIHVAATSSRYISCGSVAGQPDEDGSLFIGLRELDGFGFTGFAWPFDQDCQTTVIVFLTNCMALGAAESIEATATPEA